MLRNKILSLFIFLLLTFLGIQTFIYANDGVEKIKLHGENLYCYLYWDANDQLEQLVIKDDMHEVPEVYLKGVLLGDGTIVQELDIKSAQTFVDYPDGTVVKIYHKDRILIKKEQYNPDGALVMLNEYRNQWIIKSSVDQNADGVMDEFTYFDDNKQIVKAEIDYDNDGKIDETLLPGKDF